MSPTAREQFVTWCHWGVAHAGSIHYDQARPFAVGTASGHLPLTSDCSGLITIFCKWSGLPDPNGLGYNGQGFTGTLLDHLTHIPRKNAVVGDLGVYGSGDGTHVIVLLEAGTHSDPLVFSHGQEIGPLQLRLSAETKAHAGQFLTFLRLSDPERHWRFNQGNGLSQPKSLGECIAQLRRMQQDKSHDREITIHRYAKAQT